MPIVFSFRYDLIAIVFIFRMVRCSCFYFRYGLMANVLKLGIY